MSCHPHCHSPSPSTAILSLEAYNRIPTPLPASQHSNQWDPTISLRDSSAQTPQCWPASLSVKAEVLFAKSLSSLTPHPKFPLAHSYPATQASLFHKHVRYSSAPEPSRCLFALPGTHFSPRHPQVNSLIIFSMELALTLFKTVTHTLSSQCLYLALFSTHRTHNSIHHMLYFLFFKIIFTACLFQ